MFYDNIHYFLQEYVAWEKTYTSQYGALNDFDYENYLQFVPGGDDVTFRSSQDIVPTGINNLVWDFTGDYFVSDIPGDMYLKNLVLDYDFFTDEYFELSVINDYRIELFHPDSETLYEFEGRGYIEYRQAESAAGGKGTGITGKLRKQKTEKKDNPRSNTRE